MNIQTFNNCLIAGWLMILTGGMVISIGWGLLVAGTSFILLTLMSAKIGGIFNAEVETKADEATN